MVGRMSNYFCSVARCAFSVSIFLLSFSLEVFAHPCDVKVYDLNYDVRSQINIQLSFTELPTKFKKGISQAWDFDYNQELEKALELKRYNVIHVDSSPRPFFPSTEENSVLNFGSYSKLPYLNELGQGALIASFEVKIERKPFYMDFVLSEIKDVGGKLEEVPFHQKKIEFAFSGIGRFLRRGFDFDKVARQAFDEIPECVEDANQLRTGLTPSCSSVSCHGARCHCCSCSHLSRGILSCDSASCDPCSYHLSSNRSTSDHCLGWYF